MTETAKQVASFGFSIPLRATRVAAFGYYEAVYPGAPDDPVGIYAEVLSSTRVKVGCDFTPNTNAYEYWRSEEAGAFILLTTVASNSYTDATAQPGYLYTYKIIARNVNGPSDFSDAVTAQTPSDAIVDYPHAINILPVDYELAFLRSVQDEKVELHGLPCKLFRWQDAGRSKRQYNTFDELIVTNTVMPTAVTTFVALEVYQDGSSRTGEHRGREFSELPLVGMFRFADRVMKNDLVEIDWQFAQASGRIGYYSGLIGQPVETLPTRFKIVDRRMNGINGDMTNKFAMVPTEETWA